MSHSDYYGLEMCFLESWHGWDEVGSHSLQFYEARPNAYLKNLLGPVDSELVDSAYLDSETSTFEVYDCEGRVLATFTILCELERRK